MSESNVTSPYRSLGVTKASRDHNSC